MAVPCHSGWNSNFELYEGTSKSNETITMYNYIYAQDGRWSTNLFLRNDIDLPDYLTFQQIHNIPGKIITKVLLLIVVDFNFSCSTRNIST